MALCVERHAMDLPPSLNWKKILGQWYEEYLETFPHTEKACKQPGVITTKLRCLSICKLKASRRTVHTLLYWIPIVTTILDFTASALSSLCSGRRRGSRVLATRFPTRCFGSADSAGSLNMPFMDALHVKYFDKAEELLPKSEPMLLRKKHKNCLMSHHLCKAVRKK